MKRFAPLVRKFIDTWWGPEPVGIATARRLSMYRAQQLGVGNGTPHFGMKGDPSVTWMGWTASPQGFIGNAQMGSIRGETAPVDPATAFPNATAPSALGSWLDQYESLQELIGSGS